MSGLASVIGSDPEDLAEWKSLMVPASCAPSVLHARFWGKSMADEEQEWRTSHWQPPIAEEHKDDGEDVKMVASEDEAEDDIIPGCYFLDIGVEGIEYSSIWIRADYIRIYNRLEDYYFKVGSKGRAPGAVLTGQPGIGKSVWIYYALRRRLAEKKPLIWLKRGTHYLFVEEGVYEMPPKFQQVEFCTIVWTLVDSDEGKDGVPPYLIPHGTRLFVIYTTSPNNERWSRMSKTVLKIVLIMNPWTRNEILRVTASAESEKIERTIANDAFDRLGPTPRICIETMRLKEVREDFEHEVNTAISNITPNQLENLFKSARALNIDAVSPKIFLIRRQDRENVHSQVVVKPITQSIQSRLANRFRTLEQAEQVRLYNRWALVPATAGIFFEATGQRRLQDGMALQLVPMVQLPKGSLPQWYSSHILLLDASLEGSRQQLMINVKPSRTIEYDDDGLKTILPNVFYVPQTTNRNALHSFILIRNHLHIFQFGIGLKPGMKPGLLDFFGKCQGLPLMDCWRFVFIIPPNRTLICPRPLALTLRQLSVYSAVVDLNPS